eukprot:TRINITY_DN36226_c0_g1_i1.p1 TRINITY_DN36226_c0_g1~~TRINITY_DN36226_c0_g1_i1.p1  ORF type:complete len:111 (-),score=11.27 TRINITY_DN36226_c0_g1_i1:48-356(-)
MGIVQSLTEMHLIRSSTLACSLLFHFVFPREDEAYFNMVSEDEYCDQEKRLVTYSSTIILGNQCRSFIHGPEKKKGKTGVRTCFRARRSTCVETKMIYVLLQ